MLAGPPNKKKPDLVPSKRKFWTLPQSGTLVPAMPSEPKEFSSEVTKLDP